MSLKTLLKLLSLVGVIANIYQVAKRFLPTHFSSLFPVSHTRKTYMEIKSKLSSSCQSSLGWFSNLPGCTSESPGSPHPTRGQGTESVWAGVILKQPPCKSPECPWRDSALLWVVTCFPCWGHCQPRNQSFCLNESVKQLLQIPPNRSPGVQGWPELTEFNGHALILGFKQLFN